MSPPRVLFMRIGKLHPVRPKKKEKLDCCLQQPKLIKIYTKFMAESDFAVLMYFDFSKDTTKKKKKKTKKTKKTKQA